MHPHTAIEDQALARSHYGVMHRVWLSDRPDMGGQVLLNADVGGPEDVTPMVSATINADLEEPVQRAELRFSRLSPLHVLGSLSPYMDSAQTLIFGRPLFDPGMYVKLETKCVGLGEPDSLEAQPPVYAGQGSVAIGSNSNPVSRKPTWPPGHQAGDVGLLYVKTGNQAPVFDNLTGFEFVNSQAIGSAGGGTAEVDFDNKAENNGTGSTVDVTIVPVGTVKGVVVLITQDTSSADLIASVKLNPAGANLTMTRAPNGRGIDTAGSVGAAYAYHIGASIPAGTLTIRVNKSDATTPIHVTVATLTASRDTEVVDSDKLDQNRANPQVVLQYFGRPCLSFCAAYSGFNTTASLTELGTMVRAHDHRFPSLTESSYASRQSNPGTADFTIGYTSTTENCAFVALAIGTVPATGGGVRLDTYLARATSSTMPPPEIQVPSDHIVAQILGFRGCVPTGNPIHVSGGDTNAGPTNVQLGGIATTPNSTIPQCLLVGAVAHAIDSTSPQLTLLTTSEGPFLPGQAERTDVSTSQGSGGGFAVATGVRVNPGPGLLFGSALQNTPQARFTVLLQPAPPPPGPQDPDDIPWRPVFVGRIDVTDPAQGGEVVLQCRDIFADVLDEWIEPGPAGGWPMGDAEIDEHLDQLLVVSQSASLLEVPFAVVGFPNLFIPPYMQQPGSKLLAMRQAGLQNGWDLRGRWGTQPFGPDNFVLTYYEPDRFYTGIRLILRPDRYFTVPSFPVSREEVRNVVEVTPSDPPRAPVKVEDVDSVFRYGRKYLGLTYDVANHIRTPLQAEVLGAAVLSDTKDPKATMEIETRFLPFVEINDLVRVQPNNVHHDDDLQVAVTGFTHTLTNTARRTTLRLRPSAAAAYRYWRSGTPKTQFSSPSIPSGHAPPGSTWIRTV